MIKELQHSFSTILNMKSYTQVHYIMFMETIHMITNTQNFEVLELGMYPTLTLDDLLWIKSKSTQHTPFWTKSWLYIGQKLTRKGEWKSLGKSIRVETILGIYPYA